MSFKDHFSSDSGGYARFRPGYPEGLFSWLARIAPGREQAVDVACGSGQATRFLGRHFSRVVGLDASAEQVDQCRPEPGLEYRVARAEETGLEPDSADLVTVAQALHWFDLDRFYPEAGRILKPGGVLAAWTYERFETGDEAIDRIVDHFYRDLLGPYWPPERVHVEAGYADLPFPFREISPPALEMKADWNLDQLIGYLGTWSAVARYRQAGNPDPLPDLAARLRAHWPESRPVVWPLRIRAGHNPGAPWAGSSPAA